MPLTTDIMPTPQDDTSSVTSAMARGPANPLYKKSSIAIRLFHHYEGKVYTAGSAIRGEAVINPLRDTRFGSLDITFIGLERTNVVATQFPQRSSHVFLKLTMPIPESKYPVPRVFEVGRTYTIPFHFVVPAHLTLSSCKHTSDSPYVLDHHMRLPPTMGSSWSRDDLAPETASVEYFVRARVVAEAQDGKRPTKLFEAQNEVLVLPPTPEDAPFNITPADTKYTMSKTKTVKKGMFSGKLGKFTATASQPSAVQVSVDGRTARSTAVTVNLGFEPENDGVPPPQVKTVSAKLTATTYYGSTPAKDLPDMGGRKEYAVEPPRLNYKSSVPLFSAEVGKVSWRLNCAPARRDSGYATESGDSDASISRRARKTKKSTAPAHAATLYIPFEIPAKQKLFLPTFHSCLVSRVYTLNLTLSVGPNNTSVSLAVPMQIMVEPSEQALAMAGPLDEALEMEVDEYLTPRIIRVPEEATADELPGYA